MFFREKTSKKSKSPVLQLVENSRTANGYKQKLIVSLGTKLHVPKEKRGEVARIVKDRLTGNQSLFGENPELIGIVDKIVKRIQVEGKWNSAREQVVKFNPKKVDNDNVAEIFIDDVQHGYGRELGPVLIGQCFWERLNFSEILNDCGFSDGQIKNAKISVLNRLIAQNSEHSIVPWLQTVAIDDILGLNTRRYGDDRFYRISDKLLKNQEFIEKSLYQKEKNLFNLTDSIFLYDLTNTYFEGVCANNPKADYNGNQKEKRTDCPQVVVALTLDQEGFIRSHRIFNGKMTDVKSLRVILGDLKDEFKDKSMPTIIFDRGMVSEENLALLKNEYNDLKYIIACRPNESSLFIKDFQEEEFSLLADRENKTNVEIFLKKVDDVVYLLCKSDGRKNKERAMRNKIEEKLESALINLQKQITNGREKNPVNIERRIGRLKEKYSKVAKYFLIEYHHREFSYCCDENIIPKRLENSLKTLKEKADGNKISFPAINKKVEELQKKYSTHFSSLNVNLKEPSLTWNTIDEIENNERQLDGNYLLKTNRLDLDQHSIWNHYMMLTRVENAFRDLKSFLGLRPNFHQKENRVDGHIFITILAYHLLHSIEYTLRQQGITSRWSTIKRVVSTHCYSTIQLPTVEGPVINLRKPGLPEGMQIDIYKKLGVAFENLPVTKNIA